MVAETMGGEDGGTRPSANRTCGPCSSPGGRAAAFVCVDPAGFAADDALAGWLQRGLEFVSGLPPKPARSR